MSLLRTLETKIEGLLEGTFGRVFASEVRPIELARKLVKEMEEHRMASVSRVYAPHDYEVWLSPEDREHYNGIEGEVIDELCAFLLEHARREELVLTARPSIRFHTDEQLTLGEFGIETHPPRVDGHDRAGGRGAGADPERSPAEDPAPPREHWLREELRAGAPRGGESSNTMIYSGSRRMREPLEGASRRREAGAILLVEGRRVVLPTAGGVLGRSRECDVVLSDSGVSRRHAAIRPAERGWLIEDLGSTNGVRVGGTAIHGSAPLRPGDRIELGSIEIVFELR